MSGKNKKNDDTTVGEGNFTDVIEGGDLEWNGSKMVLLVNIAGFVMGLMNGWWTANSTKDSDTPHKNAQIVSKAYGAVMSFMPFTKSYKGGGVGKVEYAADHTLLSHLFVLWYQTTQLAENVVLESVSFKDTYVEYLARHPTYKKVENIRSLLSNVGICAIPVPKSYVDGVDMRQKAIWDKVQAGVTPPDITESKALMSLFDDMSDLVKPSHLLTLSGTTGMLDW